jgi:hypothetical protein
METWNRETASMESLMPDREIETCPAHDDIVRGLTRNSSLVKTLLALLGVGLVVVTACITVAMAASKEASGVRHDLDVHTAGQGERMKNIEEGVTRNQRALERIEERLEELVKEKRHVSS